MNAHAQVMIRAPKAVVWKLVSDASQWESTLSAIHKLEVLELPAAGLVGLKWKETRKVFGKLATEVMWVTEAVDEEYYVTHAHSNGADYVTTVRLRALGDATQLEMVFKGTPQTLLAKLLYRVTAPLMRGSLTKLLEKDLADIKCAVETGNPE